MQGRQTPTWNAGYRKITSTCLLARNNGIHYAWVDTCCIDKSSSAELSEAINSMFRWYESAAICYAYLSDISATNTKRFTESRWFTRGWTLQELIAPGNCDFYASDWRLIGSRSDLCDRISTATKINERFLRRSRCFNDGQADISQMLRTASVAHRMSWASTRQTTRPEDLAYCLLGIFGINLPLLYGEGSQAFIRLQEEIVRHTDDHSIFSWGLHPFGHLYDDTKDEAGMLASTPEAFSHSGKMVPVDTGEDHMPFLLTNHGIQTNLRVLTRGPLSYGIFHCGPRYAARLLAIPLEPLTGNQFRRADRSSSIDWVDHQQWNKAPVRSVYLLTRPVPEKYKIPTNSFLVKPLPDGISIGRVSEDYYWDSASSVIRLARNQGRLEYVYQDCLEVQLNADFLGPDAPFDLMTVSVSTRWLREKDSEYRPRRVAYTV